MELNYIEIGKRIRRRRDDFMLTREVFSEMIDVTPKFVADIETGGKGFSLGTLSKISETLKLPTDYILFGNSDHMNNDPGFIGFMLSELTESEKAYATQILFALISALRSK